MNRTALLGCAALAALGAGVGAWLKAAQAQPATAAQGGGACEALAAPGMFAQTTVKSARMVPADAAKGMPAYCEVTAVISPAAGSTIGAVWRLPEGWGGKMLGLGGGGWAGNVSLPTATPGLKRGYATAQTDGGHSGANVWDTAWAANPEAATDFAYRAIHLTNVVGKQVVARYYGKGPSKSLYQGCSTGGRQGLMEVQRFPEDYDGVIAGAPVYTLQVQTSAVLRNQALGAADAGFTEAQFAMVNKAVLASCDAQDGAKDGLITNPNACKWDPAEIQCKAGGGADCLSAGQVKALRTAYAGVTEPDRSVSAWPLARGGEPGWSRFIQTSAGTQDATNGGGLGSLAPLILGKPFDMKTFDHKTDVAQVRSSAFAKAYEAKDPKIDAFLDRGGKLLLWHGWSDPGPSPVGTIVYYDQVKAASPKASQGVRLYLAPGVYHCGGGPGPDQIDTLAALDQWVTTGQAPATLLATKANSKLSRPLCAYPAQAHYKGSGDVDDAANWACR